VFSSFVPLSIKTSVYSRINNARLATLLRKKKRFRLNREMGRRSTGAPGVNLVAYIRAEMALGVVARGMASAFQAAGVHFNVINLEAGNYSSHTDQTWSHKESRRADYDTTIVCVNPDNSFHLRTQAPVDVLGDRYVIGNWYWELPELPDEWVKEFEYVDEVWAASQFIADAVSRRSPAPVVRIPPVVTLSQGVGLSRTHFGLPDNRYLFLSMFDTHSVLERKNPLGVLRAFKKAFPHDLSVGLVMKFNNTGEGQTAPREVQAELANVDNVFVIQRTLNRDEVSSLISVCDCFVSLHRAEGFGMGPAEAMSLGKPAIMTNWSGNTDYMTADNCIAVDYELVQLGRDYGPYKADQYWAEADLDQAAYSMKRVVAKPEFAKKIGLRAKQTISSQFSPQAVGRIIQERLEQIRKL
jgi:glycosyltransferase involved in cell wall biosynthesis